MRFYSAGAAATESGPSCGGSGTAQGVVVPGVTTNTNSSGVVSTVGGGVLAPLTTNHSVLVQPALSTGVYTSAAESLNAGLTRTTATLTPTTLRNIEETFMPLDGGLVAPPVSHQHQAGFVTPQVVGHVSFSQLDQNKWHGGVTTVTSVASGGGDSGGCNGRSAAATAVGTSSPLDMAATRAVPQAGHRRGGRRPKDDDEVSPEEELRRRQRRERNKQAAARCRRRRLDLTNTLQQETEELEQEGRLLQREIQQLQAQKEELNFLMEAHRGACRLGKENNAHQSQQQPPHQQQQLQQQQQQRKLSFKVEPMEEEDLEQQKRKVSLKQEPMDDDELGRLAQRPRPTTLPVLQLQHHHQQQQQLQQQQPAPQRPTSLSVASFVSSAGVAKGLSTAGPGVSIATPSQGLGLNFDSLMDGGTGLTPVSASGLMPLLPTVAGAGCLATPVTSSLAEPRRTSMTATSDTDRHLVSL